MLGTAQVATTLQAARQGAQAGEPGADSPRNPGVPDLVTLVRGALNVLDEDPDGLFLAIEGGAIDWANHQNNASRMIEEQLDFIAAMEAVIAWVEANSHWGESLLILTADHETGLLWGPRSDQVALRRPWWIKGLAGCHNWLSMPPAIPTAWCRSMRAALAANGWPGS